MNTSDNPTGGPPRGDQGDPNRPIPTPRPYGRDKGDGPHYTPWLVIRYQAGDAGDRALPGGSVFWESPDVWTMGSQGINQPVVGEATQVFARVTNFGLADAIGATVQFWWANPSIAITSASLQPIGTLTGITIPAQNSLVFQSLKDWTPVLENNGHECLIAQAFVPVFDPMTDPVNPVTDRHVGQKNEQLVTLAAGQNFQLRLEARNMSRADQQVAIEVRRGIVPRNFAKRFGRPAMFANELLDPVALLPVGIGIRAQPVGVVAASATAARLPELRAVAAPPPDCQGPALTAATQLFKAGEVRHVDVTGQLPPNALPGEVHVIRIEQRIGQMIVGGYTVYVTMAS